MSNSNDDGKWLGLITVLICSLAPSGVSRAGWIRQAKLIALDAAGSDCFARVSISGEYILVGAPWDDDKGSKSGSAYVFKREGTSWIQQAKLTAADGAADDTFGSSVCISGDYALVGAVYDDDKGDMSGAAYVFKRDGTNWIQQDKLLASDGAACDGFGVSVSISGDYCVVGALNDDDMGDYSGSAYIFKREGTDWIQQDKLIASCGAAWDQFGASVSISGDYAIVGASWHGYDCSGSAYVFRREGINWTQQDKLTPSDGGLGYRFGKSVSVSGDYALVGAGQGSDWCPGCGAAYIFTRESTNWIQQAELAASDRAYASFGYSVSVSSDYALVGAVWDDDMGSKSGSAYIFKREGASWIQQDKLVPSDGAADDEFGVCVSISGRYAVIGAVGDDDKGPESGSAYVFSPGGALAWGAGPIGPPDFNGDGKSDLLWRQATTGYQTGTLMDGLTMGSSGWLGGNTDWQIVATPDFNGDGKADLLSRQVSTGYQTATLMDGVTMAGSGWLGGNIDWPIVATPDLNGDGKADLLWRQVSTGYQTASLMDGLTMGSTGWLGGNFDWQIIATLDLNGDGKADLLWRQASTGYQTATLMDGLTMGSSGWLGGDLDWQIVAAPDFNGDGKADFLWRQLSTGYQTATLMDGLTMGSSGWLGGTLDWRIVAAPDFNGDGKADLLWRQLSTGYQTATLMDGLAMGSSGWIGGDSNWQVVATGDFNGDAKSDLLWRHHPIGWHTATLMDGLTMGSSGWIGGDGDWGIQPIP